jgi:hypothetical protein
MSLCDIEYIVMPRRVKPKKLKLRMGRQMPKGQYPVHKFRISDNPGVAQIYNQWVFGSARSRVLQRLLYLWLLIVSKDTPLSQELQKRAEEAQKKAGYFYKDSYPYQTLIDELKPEDVCKALRCSRRTAYEFMHTLEAILNKIILIAG